MGLAVVRSVGAAVVRMVAVRGADRARRCRKGVASGAGRPTVVSTNPGGSRGAVLSAPVDRAPPVGHPAAERNEEGKMSTTETPTGPADAPVEVVRSTLDPARRAEVQERLQPLLVDLIDLSLTAKQLHWNVVGPSFKSLHEQLDEVTDQYRLWLDAVAERMTSVGIAPDGRVQRVAGDSPADPAPGSWAHQGVVVSEMADRIQAVAVATRQRLEGLGDADVASEDLLIEILDGLEMQLWMFSAQQA